jgi:hypothetical protein
LTRLNLDECVLLTDEILIEIARSCPALLVFTATWCPLLRYLGVKALLGNCLRLQKLNMTGTKKLTDEAFNIYVPPSITGKDEWLRERPNALMNIKKLNLESCDYVTDKLLETIKLFFPQMTIYNYFKEEIM